VRFVELAVFDSKDVKISFLHDIERGTDNKVLTVPALRLGDCPRAPMSLSPATTTASTSTTAKTGPLPRTKEWFPDAIDSAHYLKFSKALFHVGASAAALTGSSVTASN